MVLSSHVVSSRTCKSDIITHEAKPFKKKKQLKEGKKKQHSSGNNSKLHHVLQIAVEFPIRKETIVQDGANRSPWKQGGPKLRPYLRVLYITVQSDPLPERQRSVGSEGFVGPGRHACLDDDVA